MSIFNITFAFIDVIIGYIDNIMEEKISINNKAYFDVSIKTSPRCNAKVRVMSNKDDYSHEKFNEHYKARSPLRFNNLSPMKSGKRFLNPSFGGNVATTSAEEMSFSPDDIQEITVADVILAPPDGRFTITGQVRWTEYPKQKNVYGYPRKLREGLIIDKSNHQLPITIWNEELFGVIEEGKSYQMTELVVSYFHNILRLASSGDTKISGVEVKNSFNWDQHPTEDSTRATRICCPSVIGAKVHEYSACPIISCRKKIVIVSDDKEKPRVTCPHCRQQVSTKRLTLTSCFEIVIESNSRQLHLTAFHDCVKTYFKANGEGVGNDQYVNAILEMENVDFSFDKKKIITRMVDHEDLV